MIKSEKENAKMTKITSKTIYRLHITCPAKHTTYTDYKTKKAAVKNLNEMTDRASWYATHIEKVTEVINDKS
jgi:hypothetical protein